MSSRAGSEAARLRRLKRMAGRHGLAILVATKPSSKTGGGYMISNDETHRVLLGGKPAPYALTLDEVATYLDRETTGEPQATSEDIDG